MPDEPRATEEEFRKRIIHYPDVPMVDVASGSKSHIVAGQNALVSFLTMSPHSHFEVHKHEAEQIMIVVDGCCDEIIEGKLYRVSKGDVIVLPPNVEHGGYVLDQPCVVIDIFCPPRPDYLEKAKKAMEGQA